MSPVLTNMTKQVDSREKELTHQVHRDLLVRLLERVKQLTPVLISGVKIYIGTKDHGTLSLKSSQIQRPLSRNPYDRLQIEEGNSENGSFYPFLYKYYNKFN